MSKKDETAYCKAKKLMEMFSKLEAITAAHDMYYSHVREYSYKWSKR